MGDLAMLNLAMSGNPRYQPKDLIDYFGYDRLYQPVSEVEIANLRTLAEIHVIPRKEIMMLTPAMEELLLGITTTEVDGIERNVTKHDIRAWVRIAQERMNCRLSRWLHAMLTSYDPLDTARSIQFKRSYDHVLKPSIHEAIGLMADLVEQNAGVLQIGRTHGRAALPITVGFWLATILDRMIVNAAFMDQYSQNLVGKISGAVGAYNAQVGLGITQRCGKKTYEERLLTKVGLKPGDISRQIVAPEPMNYYLFSVLMLSGAFGQFGRDGRQLMRSEIEEILESKDQGDVGSSTMTGKVNPIIFENIEGAWWKNAAEFLKPLFTVISEHQRDLVGSSLLRDFPTMVINLDTQLGNILRKDKKTQTPWLARLVVNTANCTANFNRFKHLILGEPIYIALQMAGYPGDAHKLINEEIAPINRTTKRPLIELIEEKAQSDTELGTALAAIPADVVRLLHTPEEYTGSAKGQALKIVDKAREFISN